MAKEVRKDEVTSPHTPNSYFLGDFGSTIGANGRRGGGGGAFLSAAAGGAGEDADFVSAASGGMSTITKEASGNVVNIIGLPGTPPPTSGSIGPSLWIRPGELFEGTHYILSGPEDAKLVVCITGISGYHIHYDLLAPALENDGYRVLRYDLVGRGFSEPQSPPKSTGFGGCCTSLPRQQYDLEAHLHQLAKLIEGLKLMEVHNNFHLIGYSMGGAIAVCYAHKYPEQVSTLTLMAPAGLLKPGPLKALRRSPGCSQQIVKSVIRRTQERAIRNDFVNHHTPVEERTWQQYKMMYDNNSNAFHALFQCLLQFPLTGLDDVVRDVGNRKFPILLMWGIWDRVIPYHPHFNFWKSTLGEEKNVRCEVIDNGGHGFPLERPDKTNSVILRFLKAPPYWMPPNMSFVDPQDLSPISI